MEVEVEALTSEEEIAIENTINKLNISNLSSTNTFDDSNILSESIGEAENISLSDLEEINASSLKINKQSSRYEIMMKQLTKKKEDEENLTFKPKINSNSISIVNNKSNLIVNDSSRRFELLYKDAQKRKETLTALSTSLIDKDLTFKPTISSKDRPKSRDGSSTEVESSDTQVASSNSVTERLYNASGSGRKKQTEALEQPSFKPKITKRASSIDRSLVRDTAERLYNVSKENKEKEAKLKVEAETRELATCTFTPKISRKSRSLSASRGIGSGSFCEV